MTTCSCKIQDQLPAYPAVLAVVGIYSFCNEKFAFWAKVIGELTATFFTLF